MHAPRTRSKDPTFAPAATPVPRGPSRFRPSSTGTVPAAAPNVRQYLYHLNAGIKDMTRVEARGAVVGVTPIEVERIGRAVARLRGRYLAQVVDIGGVNRQRPASEGEIAQLRRAREWYEEAAAGLEALKSAIEAGEVALDGVRLD